MASPRIAIVIAGLLGASLLGCVGASSPTPHGACKDGQVSTCACVGGGASTQVCENGAFGDCACEVTSGDLASLSPPDMAPAVVLLTTLCTYHFADTTTGWRSHDWVAGDCSNGLPKAGWVAIGQGENASGTSGEPDCANVAQGRHYTHPGNDGPSDATLRCWFAPPAAQPKPGVTVCSYAWPEVATGWRWHTWTGADCSNGLPAGSAMGVGQTGSGNGTSPLGNCTNSAQGGVYDHATLQGATSASIRCAYVDPVPVARPELTVCTFLFTDVAIGTRSHPWVAADCSHGLPTPSARAVGQAGNGNGAQEQVSCTPTAGTHVNATATQGSVRCLFQNGAT